MANEIYMKSWEASSALRTYSSKNYVRVGFQAARVRIEFDGGFGFNPQFLCSFHCE